MWHPHQRERGDATAVDPGGHDPGTGHRPDRRDRGRRGPAGHRARPRRHAGRAAVDRRRVPAHPGRAHADRRGPRRPLRAAAHVRGGAGVVHRHVAAVRPGPEPGGPDRRARPAGRGRGAAGARHPGHHLGDLHRRRPRPGDRPVGGLGRAGRRPRAARRRRPGGRALVALGVPDQPPGGRGRHRPDPLGRPGEPRRVGRGAPGPGRRRARRSGPPGRHLRAHRGAGVRLDAGGHPRRARRRRRPARGLRGRGGIGGASARAVEPVPGRQLQRGQRRHPRPVRGDHRHLLPAAPVPAGRPGLLGPARGGGRDPRDPAPAGPERAGRSMGGAPRPAVVHGRGPGDRRPRGCSCCSARAPGRPTRPRCCPRSSWSASGWR